MKNTNQIIFSAKKPSGYDQYFSNFAHSPITIEGIEYPTVEHAFQAHKTFNNTIRKEIAQLKTPGKSKRAGNKVNLRPDWEEVKYDIMVMCLREKFKIDLYKKILLCTQDAELIEDAAEWNDAIWGIGKNGKGTNLLGKALMKVRKELKENEWK
ncbi:MAG: NADAR family protein [Candidatus Scalindua sp.]|jgi:N-glycosidase YbiA|nr:NADAR family protein [Candidatus Scalindua sp.]